MNRHEEQGLRSLARRRNLCADRVLSPPCNRTRDYSTDAGPALSSIADGHLSGFFSHQPAMGPLSLYLRAPLLPRLALHDGTLGVYRWGALRPACSPSPAPQSGLAESQCGAAAGAWHQCWDRCDCPAQPTNWRRALLGPSGGAADRQPRCGIAPCRVRATSLSVRGARGLGDRQQAMGSADRRPNSPVARARAGARADRHSRGRGALLPSDGRGELHRVPACSRLHLHPPAGGNGVHLALPAVSIRECGSRTYSATFASNGCISCLGSRRLRARSSWQSGWRFPRTCGGGAAAV